MDFVPSVQVPTAQQIPLPEFKNLSLTEPTGSPKGQKDEVVIEILDQSKETDDFGATVNMSIWNRRRKMAAMSRKPRFLI
jgi:hypothetical protein